MIRMVYNSSRKLKTLIFHYWVGQGRNLGFLVTLFDFDFLVQNILKEADINVCFKVLAKFTDYKHNKNIKKCGFFFFSS